MTLENKNFDKFLDDDAVTLFGNLAELYFITLRDSGKEVAEHFFNIFMGIAEEMPVELIPEAMAFRKENAKIHFSYFDSFGYAYALKNKMKFVTGDRAFKGMKGVEIVR